MILMLLGDVFEKNQIFKRAKPALSSLSFGEVKWRG